MPLCTLLFGATSLGKRDTFTTPNMYYDPSVGDNVWDYFFEQPVSGDVDDAKNVRKNVDNDATSCPDPATASAVQLDNDSLLMLHEEERGSVFAYPHGLALPTHHAFIPRSFLVRSSFVRSTGGTVDSLLFFTWRHASPRYDILKISV